MWLSEVYDSCPYQEQGGDGFQVKASDKALQQVLWHISPRALYSMCITYALLKTRLGWLWRIGSFWQTVLTLTKMKWSVKPITIEPLIWENEAFQAFIRNFLTTNYKSDLKLLHTGETSDLVQQTVSNGWSYIGGMETGNTWNQKLIVYFPDQEKVIGNSFLNMQT